MPIVTTRRAIVIAPCLILIPGENLPFPARPKVVINKMIIEETIPILDAHVDRKITHHFVHVKIALNQLPLTRPGRAPQAVD